MKDMEISTIDEEFEKAQVKGFTRTKRGKLERVSPFERKGEKKMGKKELAKYAKQLAKTGEWKKLFGGTVGHVSVSKKYKPGQVVFPYGHGFGAVGRWTEPHYFISSYRIGGNGLYAVLSTKGKVKSLTNIRLPGERRAFGGGAGSKTSERKMTSG